MSGETVVVGGVLLVCLRRDTTCIITDECITITVNYVPASLTVLAAGTYKTLIFHFKLPCVGTVLGKGEMAYKNKLVSGERERERWRCKI